MSELDESRLRQAAIMLSESTDSVRKSLSRLQFFIEGREVRFQDLDWRLLAALRNLKLHLGPIRTDKGPIWTEPFVLKNPFVDARHRPRLVTELRSEVSALLVDVAPFLLLQAPLDDELERAGIENGAPFIELDDQGIAVLSGTAIEVQRINALLKGGMSAIEIIEDFPSLTHEHIKAVELYAHFWPQTDRKYPAKTAGSVLRRVDLSVLDLDD